MSSTRSGFLSSSLQIAYSRTLRRMSVEAAGRASVAAAQGGGVQGTAKWTPELVF